MTRADIVRRHIPVITTIASQPTAQVADSVATGRSPRCSTRIVPQIAAQREEMEFALERYTSGIVELFLRPKRPSLEREPEGLTHNITQCGAGCTIELKKKQGLINIADLRAHGGG